MLNLKQLIVLCTVGILSLGSAAHAASGNNGENVANSKDQESSIQGESKQSSGNDDQKSFASGNHVFSESSENKDPLGSEVISGKPDFNPHTVNGGNPGGDNSASPVPEPEMYAMLAAGLGLLGFLAHRKKKMFN